MHKSNLIVKAAPPSHTTSDVIEHLDLTTNFKGISVNLYVIYCIPNTSVMQFCSELADLLEGNIVHDCGHLILTSDFNIHMDNPENPNTIIFNDILESFGLTNFVGFLTYRSNHTIDLMITHHSSIIKSVRQGEFFSDHCFINTNLHINQPIPPKKIVTYRKLKNIDKIKFNCDLMDAFIFRNQSTTLEEHVSSYNTILTKTLEKHALIKTKVICDTHHFPWFNEKIKDEILLPQCKERIWQKELTEYSWRAFYNQCKYVANLIKTLQMNYYKNIIAENRTNFKAIYKIVNGLLHRKQESPLPPITPLSKLAEEFSEFFDSKIAKIMNHLQSNIEGNPQ